MLDGQKKQLAVKRSLSSTRLDSQLLVL